MKIINSIAEIKRIPVGTKLFLVNSLCGPCSPSGRIIKKVRSQDIILTIDDENHKNNGQDSYLSLSKVNVVPTENGFKMICKNELVLCAEYVFEENKNGN